MINEKFSLTNGGVATISGFPDVRKTSDGLIVTSPPRSNNRLTLDNGSLKGKEILYNGFGLIVAEDASL